LHFNRSQSVLCCQHSAARRRNLLSVIMQPPKLHQSCVDRL
jgi:hypothetical protein